MATEFFLRAQFIRNPAIAARDVVDEVVLVNPAQPGSPQFLNEVAARIWALLDGEHTVTDIRDALAAEFEANPHELEADIVELLRHLESTGAISAAQPAPQYLEALTE